MKKILSLVAFMMLITTTAFAQDKEKLSWHGEAGIGSEIEIGTCSMPSMHSTTTREEISVK